MTDDENLLFQAIAIALPGLSEAAKPYARGLMTILAAHDAVNSSFRRASPIDGRAARSLLTAPEDRWRRQKWVGPNPIFAAKGAAHADVWEYPILRALASGEAHLQTIRARLNDDENAKRAMTYRYGWALHYFWEAGLVEAVWKRKAAGNKHCFWSITPDGRRRLAELEAERWLEAESAEWTRSSYDCGTSTSPSAFEV